MVSLYQAQKKIYPRSVTGLFAKWRWFFVFATQIFFYGMPWLQWGERQAMLFDLEASPARDGVITLRPRPAAGA